MRLLTPVLLLGLMLACEPSGSSDGCAEDGQRPFGPHEGLDSRASSRRVDCGFRNTATSLRAAPDGSVWMIHYEYQDETFSAPPEKRLTHFSADGARLESLVLPELVKNFVVHPSGELTVIGWERVDDPKAIQLRRIRPDGSLVVQRLFRNETPLEERLNYVASADGTVRRETVSESARIVGILAAEAHGEELYLSANADGLRIFRLDSALRTRWSRTIAPTIRLAVDTHEEIQALGAPFSGFPMAVDESGRPFVALPFLPVTRRAWMEVFGHAPQGPDGRAILLMGLESTGEPLVERTIATDTSDELVGLVVRGGSFALGAQAKTPLDQTDKHFDSDLFFASGRLDGPATEVLSRTLSVENDEEPQAFVACQGDRYCFAGKTGFVMLDKGRSTEPPAKGFILAVDALGEQKALALFQGPRDTEILEATETPGGGVAFAFLRNEPAIVSREPNSGKGNELWLGVFNAP